jgi:glycosyltransferase involved in cell wall biosynthesis
MQMRNPVLWLNPHSAVHMVGRMGESAVVYDITDDWTSTSQSTALTRLITAQDAELCRRADAVVVCSQRLFDMKRRMVKNLYLIPNGVHAEHYGRVLDDSGPLPRAAAGWRQPVLGYVGTIHPDRVDADLVEDVARQMPDASIVLVGPDHMPPAIRERFDRCGNILRTGPVAYDDVPTYMRAFDVCITPHCVTPFTESLQPIKLWEYLAAGKPIVSTDVAGFRDYPQFVRIAKTAEEFASAAREALVESPSLAESRRAEARGHSWQARVDQIESVIERCLTKSPGCVAHPVGEVAHAG